MSMHSIEFMRAGQIAEKARQPGLVFIPVSPAYEWHSYHLPVGTDAIITEEIARQLAERFDAVYFRALSLGLDEVRDEAFKRSQGLNPEAPVFGMNYPGLPLESEYTTAEPMRALVAARLQAAKGSGFKLAIIINHHGGAGQVPLLEKLAAEFCAPGFRVEFMQTSRFAPAEPRFHAGWHAGLAETLQLMAFRPDLVDLEALPDGPLSAAQFGILHTEPLIPAHFNPRRAESSIAAAWGTALVDLMERHLRELNRSEK